MGPVGLKARHLPLAVLILLLPFGCGDQAPPASIPDGVWGMATAELDVTGTGGALTLCCATATINPPLTVSATGSFSLTGTYLSEAGPIPVGGQQPEPASFSGTLNGDHMTLTIATARSGSQTVSLVRGVHKTEFCPCPLAAEGNPR
jgi:hypothetical protein